MNVSFGIKCDIMASVPICELGVTNTMEQVTVGQRETQQSHRGQHEYPNDSC